MCSPPLREEHNQELLWKALDRGVLESVSTDHCPFNSEQKALGRDDFSKIPNGLAMIQHRLVKLWDLGVECGRITPSELVDITSTAIARRFGLERKGAVAPGKDADLVVFDPATPFEFSTRTSHMNVDYDLFEGESSTGSVRQTFCRGALVYDRGEIVSAPGTAASCRARWGRAPPWLRERRPRTGGPARAGRAIPAAPTGRGACAGPTSGCARASSCARASTSCPRVDRDLHGQLVESRAQEFARAHPLVGPAPAPRPVRAAGQAGQLAQVLQYPIRVHEATAARAPSERGTKRPWPVR